MDEIKKEIKEPTKNEIKAILKEVQDENQRLKNKLDQIKIDSEIDPKLFKAFEVLAESKNKDVDKMVNKALYTYLINNGNDKVRTILESKEK